MFERFRPDARDAVVAARRRVDTEGHRQVTEAHLLLAILDDDPNAAQAVLDAAGVDRAALAADAGRALTGDEDAVALRSLGIHLDQVEEAVEDTFGPGALRRVRLPRRTWHAFRHGDRGHFSRTAKALLEGSLREALDLGDRHIDTSHLLLAATRRRSSLAPLLARHGADRTALRRAAGRTRT